MDKKNRRQKNYISNLIINTPDSPSTSGITRLLDNSTILSPITTRKNKRVDDDSDLKSNKKLRNHFICSDSYKNTYKRNLGKELMKFNKSLSIKGLKLKRVIIVADTPEIEKPDNLGQDFDIEMTNDDQDVEFDTSDDSNQSFNLFLNENEGENDEDENNERENNEDENNEDENDEDENNEDDGMENDNSINEISNDNIIQRIKKKPFVLPFELIVKKEYIEKKKPHCTPFESLRIKDACNVSDADYHLLRKHLHVTHELCSLYSIIKLRRKFGEYYQVETTDNGLFIF